MAEGARLESVLSRKGHVGSNPTLSARERQTEAEYSRQRQTTIDNNRKRQLQAENYRSSPIPPPFREGARG